jgi:16S rRNA (cytosine967-C5)-methyltransferase
MELAQRICFASNRKPGIYLKPNGLKTTTKNLTEKFKQVCIEYEIIDNNPESNTDSYESSMIKIKSPSSITELPGFSEGLFTVQDITASRVVRMLRPQSYWTILDLCAAPGVKATQLAEFTGDSAKIVATDIDSERLKKVKENITRLDIKSVEVVPYDRIPTSKFDCVLLDVPCSNTGVLARRVETRYRITQNVVKKLTKTQQGLLNTAASMLKPNGIICYSTCSIQKEENNNLIRDFLEENPNFTLYFEKLTLQTAQQFDCDGGYMAILALK